MSSYSHTMRSRNHSFPVVWRIRPVARIHGSATISPQTMNGNPAVLTAVKTRGATRCRSGTGVVARAVQKVSPSTEREAQEFRSAGGGKALGLTAIQIQTRATGPRLHHPI